ncbi:MAG TPA: divalent metal cation transporter [Gaiellaceae bacterium]|nr:divalent metal cation transporter [Gaiellaceae bacterium]
MSRIFAFTLGTLTAIGGFLDIGDLIADAQVGARFGLSLAWVTVIATIGIVCFSEMAGRVAIASQLPPLSLARTRLGPKYAFLALLASVAITALLVMAELAGVALALELASSIHYLLWVPVAAIVLLVMVWALPFETMERFYGIVGLTMLVYLVAVWQLGPDWSRLLESATTPVPAADETWASYAFFAILLIGAQMTPYEMTFFAGGSVESRWRREDLRLMQFNALVGFPLGALIAIAIQAIAFVVFFDLGITVEHLSQTALPVALALGKIGLVIALVGIFAVTFGAAIETLFSAGYDVAQYFGWALGKVAPPVRTARFMVLVAMLVLGGTIFALTTVNPITVTVVAVAISGALLPFLYLPVLLVANDRKVMGDLANGPLSNTVGTLALVVSIVVSIAALPLLILTRAGAA